MKGIFPQLAGLLFLTSITVQAQEPIKLLDEKYLTICEDKNCETTYIPYEHTQSYLIGFVLPDPEFKFTEEFRFSVGEANGRGIHLSDTTYRSGEEYFIQLYIPDSLVDVSPVTITGTDGKHKKEYKLGFRVQAPQIDSVVYKQDGKIARLMDFSQPVNSPVEMLVYGKNFYTSTQLIKNRSINLNVERDTMSNSLLRLSGQLLPSGFPYKPDIYLQNPGNEVVGYHRIAHIAPAPKIDKDIDRKISDVLFPGTRNTINITGSYLDGVKISAIKAIPPGSDYPKIQSIEKNEQQSSDSVLTVHISIGAFANTSDYARYRMVFQNEFGASDSAEFELSRNQSPVVVFNKESKNESSQDFIYHNHRNSISVSNSTLEETLLNNFNQVSAGELILYIDGMKIDNAEFTIENKNTVSVDFNYQLIDYSTLSRSTPKVSPGHKLRITSSDEKYTWIARVKLIHKPVILKTFPSELVLRPNDEVRLEVKGFFLDNFTTRSNPYFTASKISSGTTYTDSVSYVVRSNPQVTPNFESELEFSDGKLSDFKIDVRGENWQDPGEYASIQLMNGPIPLSQLDDQTLYTFKLSEGIKIITDNSRLQNAFSTQKFTYWIESEGVEYSSDTIEVARTLPDESRTVDVSMLKTWTPARICYKVPDGATRCINVQPMQRGWERWFVIPSISTGVIGLGKDPFSSMNESGIAPGLGIGYQWNSYLGFNLSLSHLASFEDETSLDNRGNTLTDPITYTAKKAGIGLSGGIVFKKNLVLNLGYDFRKRDDRYNANNFNDRFYILISAGISLNFGLNE